MWRSQYDMPPDDFAKELDRLWDQVRPLYLSLHAYVRARLREKYGDAVPANGPIPAAPARQHVGAGLGQHLPAGRSPPMPTPATTSPRSSKKRNTDWKQMVKYGEGFFVSLGFDPLPQTFWERSLFLKPRDRDVVCHASAWDVDTPSDLRLKMCIQITGEDFLTIHHELGHNFYQRAYSKQPPLLPQQRQRWLPRGHRRHHRALHHAGIPGEARPARSARRIPPRTSACCCTRRSRRSPSCPSAW